MKGIPKRPLNCLLSGPWLKVALFDLFPAANKAKVLYGMPRDPDLQAALTQMEEEESENNTEEEKPKVGMSVCT